MLSTIRYLPISSTLALPRALHKQGVNNAYHCGATFCSLKRLPSPIGRRALQCNAAERETALYYAFVSPIGDASLAIRHGWDYDGSITQLVFCPKERKMGQSGSSRIHYLADEGSRSGWVGVVAHVPL